MNHDQQGDPVNEARLLIPWYITGKLSEPERKLVEEMLEQHSDLKADYLQEMKTVDLLRANDSLLQLTAVDSTQQRLDKLMKRIQREEATEFVEQKTLPSTQIENKIPTGFSWVAFFRNLLPSMEWLTPANAVLASLLLIQAGFAGWFAHSFMSPKEQDMIYATVTAPDGKQEVSVVNGMVLLVDFNENAQMWQVRDFLNKWNARFLDGPDQSSLFKIEIRGVSPQDKRSDNVLLQMQQDQTVISFVGREF